MSHRGLRCVGGGHGTTGGQWVSVHRRRSVDGGITGIATEHIGHWRARCKRGIVAAVRWSGRAGCGTETLEL